MKISPIIYMGSKRRLISKGLLEYFPKNINTFVDAFAGSLTVSLNVKANSYIINDKDYRIFSIYKLLKKFSQDREKLIVRLRFLIKKFHLPHKRNQQKKNKYIKSYETFRNFYNKNKKPIYLFLLHYYSFCHLIRFTNNKFNVALGSNILNKHAIYNILNFDLFDKKITLLNRSYSDIDYSKLRENDFVYFDPPYYGSMAVYNEGAKDRSWGLDDDLALRKLCDKLTKHNIKWGMSNVFSNKGIDSNNLKNWVSKNKYKVIHFNIVYHIGRLDKSKESTDEVFICNYEPKYGLFS